MPEVVLTVLKWLLKASFFIAIALSFIGMTGLIVQYMVVTFNATVLAEVFGMIQLWLPFNLNVILIWMGLSVTAYILYLVATRLMDILDTWLGTL